MWLTVAPRVLSFPPRTWCTESPTSRASTCGARRRANSASYAVSTASFFPALATAWKSWMVLTLVSALIGLQLLHLPRPPVARGHPGMGHGESGFVEHHVTVTYDIEVQRARSPLVGAAGPAGLPLDLEAGVEEDPGRERGLQQHHLVQVVGLGDVAQRLGLLDRRRSQQQR